MKKDLIISGIIGLLGIILLFVTTNGFTAFTLEQQRLQDLKAQPPVFPDVEVVDQNGETYNFDAFEGKHVFMTFIYTSCSTACPEMTSNMKHVYDMTDAQYFDDDVIFLSISFDTKRDTVEVLERYAGYFNVDGETWKMLRVPNDDHLTELLSTYGVTVIPEGDADYQHNTSFYVLKPDGQLAEVLDFKDIDGAANRLVELIDEEGTS